MPRTNLTIILVFVSVFSTQAQDAKKDYYNVPQPIKFHGKSYSLHNSYKEDIYDSYHQEYIPAEEENFAVIPDILTVDLYVLSIAKDSITNLIEHNINSDISDGVHLKKLGDIRLFDYKVYKHPEKGETVLELITSQEQREGQGDACCDNIIQWKISKYLVYEDASGKKGIVCFSHMSQYIFGRLQGRMETFIEQTRPVQLDYLNAVINYKISDIKLVK